MIGQLKHRSMVLNKYKVNLDSSELYAGAGGTLEKLQKNNALLQESLQMF